MEEKVPNNQDIDLKNAYQHILLENERLRADLTDMSQKNVLALELIAEVAKNDENLVHSSDELQIKSQQLIQAQARQLEEQKSLLAAEIENRQKRESAMGHSGDLLSTVINVGLDGIMAYEAVRNSCGEIQDFKWILLNTAAAALLGHRLDELMGQNLLEGFPYVKEIGLFADYVGVLASAQPLEREYYIAELAAWIQIVAVPLGDGLAVTARNVTHAKEVEQELERLANLDGLTQIANRRVLDETLLREWKRCNRNQLPLTVMICDIDFFKRFNDTYGYIVGDACLIQIARSMTQVVRRPGDLVARYGGNEFVVILSETNVEGARKVAENICTAVQNLPIEHPGLEEPVYTTLSVGLASWIPGDDHKPESLLEAADVALFHSKEQGRNRVTVCDA